jgi:hypothetical protein
LCCRCFSACLARFFAELVFAKAATPLKRGECQGAT